MKSAPLWASGAAQATTQGTNRNPPAGCPQLPANQTSSRLLPMRRSCLNPGGTMTADRLPDRGIVLKRRAEPGEHRAPCPECDRGPCDDALAVRIGQEGAATWFCHNMFLTSQEYSSGHSWLPQDKNEQK